MLMEDVTNCISVVKVSTISNNIITFITTGYQNGANAIYDGTMARSEVICLCAMAAYSIGYIACDVNCVG